jgi:exodeoxyribonuclease VII large subunit
MDEVWTIAGITRYIREIFEIDYELQDLWVQGEISNLTQARSGHLYFTLKDAESQLKSVMWRRDAALLPFYPQHGDAVRAHGRISVYEAGGVYQLYADQLLPVGGGDLHQQFEALKAQLDAEGLFDPSRKKELPAFPQRIGVVTSPDAAALRDVLSVLERRYPLAEVLLAPTLVQGADAPSQIVRALVELDGRDDVDLIILTRGGGSLEDLWAFNDERVARAVAGCRHPIISGVGHETDFTIADFAADLRAPTPSAAAELATPDVNELALSLDSWRRRLAGSLLGRVDEARWRVEAAGRALRALSPSQRLDNMVQQLDGLQVRADRAMMALMQSSRQSLTSLERTLQAVSPLATLARGYAVVRRVESWNIVRDPVQVATGDRLDVRVHGGHFAATVSD